MPTESDVDMLGDMEPGRPIRELKLEAVLDGSVRIVEMQRSGTTCRLVLRQQDRPPHGLLSLRERTILGRLSRGHCQKLVAYDFGLAHTTVSSHLRGALDKLGLARWEHVVLVTAAIEAAGTRVEPVDERPETAELSGGPGPFLVVRCELSRAALLGLTEAEREVALLVVDGCANAEIGRERGCSPRTVANQISSVFRKLQVHGRCELIRLLVLTPQPGESLAAASDIAPHPSDRRLVGATNREGTGIAPGAGAERLAV